VQVVAANGGAILRVGIVILLRHRFYSTIKRIMYINFQGARPENLVLWNRSSACTNTHTCSHLGLKPYTCQSRIF
jgi:hypothetical protein